MKSLYHLSHFFTIFSHLQIQSLANSASRSCKATPGLSSWPSSTEWISLNRTLSGRLIRAVPPAAPCHPDQPSFDNATCAYIVSAWGNSTFHDRDPVSVDYNNWADESCLPSPYAPCTGKGYPIYVINAFSTRDVKIGVDFAREKNVRLIVKSSGHDYLGRSAAPNSLSIWTHHLRDMKFHESFTPKGCKGRIDTAAVTIGAGMQMAEIYAEAGKLNLTIVGGASPTVSVGGFLTGGGHSPLSARYGLGADQVLEIEVVTASGEVVTANECQNTDIFWAIRGGGGFSFGIATSFTVKTFPTTPVSQLSVLAGGAFDSDAYWNAMAYLLSQSPRLSDAGVSAYTYMIRTVNSTTSGFLGLFFAPDKSLAELLKLFAPIEEYVNNTWPDQIVFTAMPAEAPDFYSWWKLIETPSGVGVNTLLGSRLLDCETLSKPLPVLKQSLQDAVPYDGTVVTHLVAGRGVREAKPRGGGDAVNPAWRKAYLHFVISQSWPSLNNTAKLEVRREIEKHTAVLRKLEPDSGAYMNEASPYEPHYQQAFWGSNYLRLAKIKRRVDPDNLFWCHPCVGDEGWEEVGDRLCRVRGNYY